MNSLCAQKSFSPSKLWALVGASLAIVLGAKLWMVWSLGSITPFWDQWDAEAADLYKPWIEGRASWSTFFAWHNEHRIFTTRLIHLGLFELNDRQWNPLLQMTVNALLHVAAIGVFIGWVQTVLPRHLTWVLWIFGTLLFVIPFGWDNTLGGFQTQFYLLLLFSFLLLWLCTAADFTLFPSVICVVLALLLLLTMASGALGVIAAAVVLGARRIALGDRGVPLLLPLLLGGLAAAAILLTPSLEHHQALKARTPVEFLLGLGRVAGWPLRTTGVNLYSALLPVLMQAPLLVAVVVLRPTSKENRRAFLFLLAITLWFWLQALAFAYARYQTGLGSRYLDILAVGVVANFAALLLLWTQTRSRPRWRWPVTALASLWLAMVLLNIGLTLPSLRSDLAMKARESAAQQRNVIAYLATGDKRWLFAAGPMEIPYPDAQRLQQLLDDATIRTFLPGTLFVFNPVEK